MHAQKQADENRGDEARPTISRLLWRALRLRCPRCGEGVAFRGWFAMYDACPVCGRKFQRAPGYFLGAIYFNYGVTAALMIAGYFALFFWQGRVSHLELGFLAAFCLLFPLWFFRYSRALWMAFDESWDPWPNEEELRAGAVILDASARSE
jgi:uncharacterized protein (DUF983 family)